jgi:plastocyanin
MKKSREAAMSDDYIIHDHNYGSIDGRRLLFSVTAVLLALLAITVLALAQDKTGPADIQGDNQVSIDNFSFTPQTLTISAGTKVTWVNHDDVGHTVTSNDGKFKSKTLDTNESFSYTFTDSGTYEYHCSVHPRMTAKVIVQ